MPEWLFAFILLIAICVLGVYIVKGIDGFKDMTTYGTSAQDALEYAYSLGMTGQYKPKTQTNSSYTNPPTFSCATYKGNNCNTKYSCCIEACNGVAACSRKCMTAFDTCKKNNADDDGTHVTNDVSNNNLNLKWLQKNESPSSDVWWKQRHSHKHTPTSTQLQTAQWDGIDDVTPYSRHTGDTHSQYNRQWEKHRSSGNTHSAYDVDKYNMGSSEYVAPSLRDLIRSDMDEAVGSLVEKEVLQLKNQYQL